MQNGCDCNCNSSYKKLININLGGRAVSIGIDPSDDNKVWVATPTGGLYHSATGGNTWAKVDAFPEFGCFDVKVSSRDPNTIIVTCIEDTKAVNGGGIWLSQDGGNTWNQPPTSKIAGTRYSAYGISFMPGTSNVYVGTDSGLAVSKDLGVTWQFTNPLGKTINPIYSVVASASGEIVTKGLNGIQFSPDVLVSPGQNYQWYPPHTQISSGDRVHNSLAVFTVNNYNLLFYSTQIPNPGLFYSMDGGGSWKEVPYDDFSGVPGAYQGNIQRQNYVKLVRSASGNKNEYDLYYSDASVVCRKKILWDGSLINFGTTWEVLHFSHPDPTDIEFSNDGMHPIYASDDGGIEKSTDGGLTWSMVGVYGNGFGAFQIYDVKTVLSPTSYVNNDIYFGTQDNYLHSSPDNGITWSGFQGPEGGVFQGPIRKPSIGTYAMSDFITGSDEAFYHFEPMFDNKQLTSHPYAYTDASSNAVYYIRDNTFAMMGPDINGVDRLFISPDGCNTWNPNPPIASIPYQLNPLAFISGSSANPSIICPYAGNAILQINNAFNAITGDEFIEPVLLPAHYELGTYGQQGISNLFSFGVDPADTNFMILPDIGNNQIFITTDHGAHWKPNTELWNIITDYGKFLFNIPGYSNRPIFELNQSQVSCITFDPSNSDHILIGTAEAGIICSQDHGTTWAKIKDSEKIPNVTSFSFMQSNLAYVSTWGAGIWVISLDNTVRTIPPAPSRRP